MRELKLKAAGYWIPVKIEETDNSYYFHFPFNRALMEEIKSMDGSKFHGYDEKNPRKVWSVTKSQRNDFQLQYLASGRDGIIDPYAHYDINPPAVKLTPRKHKIKNQIIDYMKAQKEMIPFMWHRHWCIVAGEMGLGKSLATATVAEMACDSWRKKNILPKWWYVGPTSALMSVVRDLEIWGFTLPMEMMTYNALVSRMKKWRTGDKAPPGIWFDEISKAKTPTTQRSQACKAIADGVRADWGQDSFVIGSTGTPAPKSPIDWWNLAEIICPGFLKEGNIFKFKNRLAVVEQKQGFDGGTYPELVTWRDSELKCKICGRFAEDPIHNVQFAELTGSDGSHLFEKGFNEVQHLYNRLKGLVIVMFKKDYTDLPDKIYRIIELKPKPSMLRVANTIVAASPTVIQGLTLLRELSDGFQYIDVPIDEPKTCPLCEGSKEIDHPVESCPNCHQDLEVGDTPDCPDHKPTITITKVKCPHCGGKGTVQDFRREIKEVETPKDQALIDLLEEHEDIGRMVIFGGFTGSLDRVCRICWKEGWATIRVDQGKWEFRGTNGLKIDTTDFLSIFQDKQEEYPRVAFVANPASGGMGLTLTASPTILYFSNTFNAEDRIQSEDRIHRPGMDVNRGATIIDLIHLSSDQKILDNLKKKRDLQAMTLGEFRNDFNEGESRQLWQTE